MKRVVSAGGIVWRRSQSGDIEVVVCGRSNDRVWALPKGTPDPRERLVETAIREVEEETGLKVKPGQKLGVIDFWFAVDGVRYHKFVHHWLMEPVGGDTSLHDEEFDAVVWQNIGEAKRSLTYPTERGLLEEAERAIDEALP